MVKNLPAMWKTWVRSLGLEDPLEKGMATYSSILAQRIPWTELAGDKGRGEGGWMLGRQLTQYLFFRYMQSFLELLEYENKSPEDPQVLDK